jgi:hypothetical protein
MKTSLSLLALTLVLAAGAAHAQGPGSGGPVPQPEQPTAIPIDGGASLLAAGAVAYGLRHLRQRRRAR